MRVRSSSAAALAVSLLVSDVLAAAHGRHQHLHRKRTKLTVTDDVMETKTEIIYVTVDWPSGETVGVEYPTDWPPPAAAATTSTAAADNTPVTDTFMPTSTSSVVPVPPTEAKPSTSSTSAVADGAAFIQQPASASSPEAAVPTTMATIVKPANTPVVDAAATPAAGSSGTGSGSGNKRGLAYNTASLTQYFAGGNSKVSWAYNWGQTSSGSVTGFEYVPMLWNNDPSRVKDWNNNANAAIASGSTHLFSFNEPDLGSQANMAVSVAAEAYKQYMQPFASKAKLGAPAVTNGGGSMGLSYLSSFISACSGCTIDFVNIHWYDSATNFAYFKSHVQDAYKAGGGRPVWITEFAASGSAAEQNTFLQIVIPWLDAQPYVERYAYFMVSEGVLISGNGLSTLGSTFESYTSSAISSLIANA